jgi:SAM-dependent methyltransferase
VSRSADPCLAPRLTQLIGCQPAGAYLDLGCGTGNYTRALAAGGGHWTGLDISAVMLSQAREHHSQVRWVLGDASHLPFADGSFDGVVCTLAIHHFPELQQPSSEVRRVLQGGSFVVFTSLAEQMRGYWLWHYFSKMMERSTLRMPSQTTIIDALKAAGFSSASVETYWVLDSLQDLFLYSGKSRPLLYLDPAVRANISSFANLCDADELSRGTGALARDIRSGFFNAVAAQFSSDAGDYAFIVAT